MVHNRAADFEGNQARMPVQRRRTAFNFPSLSFRGDANGSRERAPDDRLRIERGISRFPDVQLHIRGLVLRTIPE
jgi:hypothetical protein